MGGVKRKSFVYDKKEWTAEEQERLIDALMRTDLKYQDDFAELVGSDKTVEDVLEKIYVIKRKLEKKEIVNPRLAKIMYNRRILQMERKFTEEMK